MKNIVVLACASTVVAVGANAQASTNRIVVGFTAGGSADVAARILAERLAEITGENYIIENRTGAAGRLAVRHTKDSAPDGRTLMMVPHGPMTLFPHLFTQLDFDPATDFTPISRLATFDFALVANNDIPIENGEQLKAWVNENPDRASYGSSGAGTVPHFIGEIVADRLDVNLTSVPYKGAALTINDVVGGIVPLGIISSADAVPVARGDRLRIIGTSGNERSELAPEFPTMREVGIDYAIDGWYAVYGPAGIEPDVVERLNAVIREALEHPVLVERYASLGLTAAGSSPEELAELQADETEVWRAAVEQTGFKPLD